MNKSLNPKGNQLPISSLFRKTIDGIRKLLTNQVVKVATEPEPEPKIVEDSKAKPEVEESEPKVKEALIEIHVD